MGSQIKFTTARLKLLDDGNPQPLTLNGIQVIDLLGRGRHGSVYKGIWNQSTYVALKCQNKPEEHISNKNFKQEIKILM